MSERNGHETEEWIPISEAARRLNVSDRHARRLAAKLSDSDRQSPTSGAVRVRLAALAALVPSSAEESDTGGPGPTSAEGTADITMALQQEIALLQADLAAVVKERDGLAADKVRLNDLIDRHMQGEAEMRRLMLTAMNEVQTLRQQLAIAAAPPTEAAQETSAAAVVVTEATMPGERTSGKLSWWQRLFRKGKT